MTDKQKNVYVVWQNSDLTEGKGHLIPIAVCEIRSTAIRMAKNAGVMGSDADVSTFPAIFHAGSWCAPFEMVKPSAQDKESQITEDFRQAAMAKARDAGLSDEDIRSLMGLWK